MISKLLMLLVQMNAMSFNISMKQLAIVSLLSSVSYYAHQDRISTLDLHANANR